MNRGLILGICCCLWASSARAEQGITASDVRRWCSMVTENSAPNFESGYCLGFMRGILDGIHFTDLDKCVPRGTSPVQAAQIYKKYATEHPEGLRKAYADLAAEALRSSFPCSAK